jgi:transcriptional regulator NrdR family protein
MRCPFCESDTSVEISRPSLKIPSVWRRRQCKNCHKVLSTREKPDLALSFLVKKEAGHEEPFSEDKLLMSVYECLTHRKDALEASKALSDTVTRMLLPRKSGIIVETEIKTTILKVLKRFDGAAFTYYKAHHR